MDAALALAARGLGNVWPNPAVGCVLVRDGRVVGRGWTQPGGRPHAETEALARAGGAARGATAYVTLEPCSHHGRTPPCVDALIAAGIVRCVVACGDSDPRVSGKGIAALRAAGIEVVEGVREAEARRLNAGFFNRLDEGRPLVTLKIATSLDGRIAAASGESKWITGPQARQRAHLERARHDAVLIGSGTARADDPDLTCRLAGVDPRPVVRVVLDSRLTLDPQSHLVRSAAVAPTWIFRLHDDEGGADAARAFEASGAEVLPVRAARDGGLDLGAVLETLAGRGITRVLVEGGGRVAASLLAHGLVDRLVWFRAAKVIGGGGLPGVGDLGLDRLADCPDFSRRAIEAVGGDLLEIYERR
ncbi:bifunctional diaminohydroxyphosphoribosylaminopyrimidine deaminase/5-amino-6-(5-phosphoribosylamino)uracil reductase RibD [Novispirillum sp. DQ9]|uniref:bifunctional diaminohydroxyphosphoribosylaminopyrimidine deaminase/5-amino-6-(5-phosphoribosylamino)uracil reductase RibD n=1 Tax=Novispirillum sp. DQ9 TaxID=3398612 RepID=UPI003C7DA1A8